MDSWGRDKITEIVGSRLNGRWPSDPKAFNEIYQGVCQAKAAETYFGLTNVLIEYSNQLPAQKLATKLLKKINKKSHESPHELLSRVLEHWNVSAPDLVGYCVHQYGKEELLEVCSRLKNSLVTERSLAALNSFTFWLHGYEK